MEQDKICWLGDKARVYAVSSAYHWRNYSNTHIQWPWKADIPYKVACFVWLAVKRACLYQDTLQRRDIYLFSIYLLCGECAKTNNQLFLHCSVTTQLRDIFLVNFGLSWAMPTNTLEFGRMQQLEQERWNQSPKKIWKTIPGCIWWNS